MAESTEVGLRPIEAQDYREVLTRFATGVTVVTTLEQTDEGGQPWGTTVNSFTGISLDPPLVLVSIGRERSIHPIIDIACGPTVVNHQPEFAAATVAPGGDKAILDGALALAWTAIDAATRDEVRARLVR